MGIDIDITEVIEVKNAWNGLDMFKEYLKTDGQRKYPNGHHWTEVRREDQKDTRETEVKEAMDTRGLNKRICRV